MEISPWMRLKGKRAFRGNVFGARCVFFYSGLIVLLWGFYLLSTLSAWKGIAVSFLVIKHDDDCTQSSLDISHTSLNCKSNIGDNIRVHPEYNTEIIPMREKGMIADLTKHMVTDSSRNDYVDFWETSFQNRDKNVIPKATTVPDIKDSMENTEEVWNKSDLYETNLNFLLPKLREKGCRVVEGQGSRRHQPGTDYERWIMSTPALSNFVQAPDEHLSRVQIDSPKQFYQVGDQIQIRVHLYNGLGQQRTSGGDEVRMRIISSDGMKAVAGEVTDMRNGSYVATSSLQWAGATLVQVYLTYSREYLREVVRLRLTLHSTFWNGMAYSADGGIEEITACLPSLPIPGYASVCNLTDENGGLSYFCGFPTDSRLDCSHRGKIRDLLGFQRLPLSPKYEQLRGKIDTMPYLRLIPNNIYLTAYPRFRKKPPPCWALPARDTWLNRAPRGWWDNAIWRPLSCSYKRLHAAKVQACLRDTTLYLLGDSNMRMWWEAIKKYLVCNQLELGHRHKHKLCKMKSLNITLKSAIHGQPAHIAPIGDTVPLPMALEELRYHSHHMGQKVILVLHYYLHFSYYGLGVFQDRVKAARRSIEEFLKENPSAKVLIRGPHVVFDGYGKHFERGDNYGPAYIKLWRKEFQGLWDKVWFLDFWDMTTASENMSSHPANHVVREMVKVLFGHICGEVS